MVIWPLPSCLAFGVDNLANDSRVATTLSKSGGCSSLEFLNDELRVSFGPDVLLPVEPVLCSGNDCFEPNPAFDNRLDDANTFHAPMICLITSTIFLSRLEVSSTTALRKPWK
ncbi:MAG: hypothetical protein ACPIOQ_16510 [Promethearchaeia archaeon]